MVRRNASMEYLQLGVAHACQVPRPGQIASRPARFLNHDDVDPRNLSNGGSTIRPRRCCPRFVPPPGYARIPKPSSSWYGASWRLAPNLGSAAEKIGPDAVGNAYGRFVCAAREMCERGFRGYRVGLSCGL